jgi:hypothetical protein
MKDMHTFATSMIYISSKKRHTLYKQQTTTKRKQPIYNDMLHFVVTVSVVALLSSQKHPLQTIISIGRPVGAFSVGNNSNKIVRHQNPKKNINNSRMQQTITRTVDNTWIVSENVVSLSLSSSSLQQSTHDDAQDINKIDSKITSSEDNNTDDDDAITTNTNINNLLSLDYNDVLVTPVQGFVDTVTGGWGMTYADLSPDDTTTVTGRKFLASNIAYFIGGAILTVQGDIWLGVCTELCAIASFNYHYQQLVNTGSQAKQSPDVRLALLVDYIFALLSILTALVYIITNPATFTGEIPFYSIGISFIACACLGLSWVWEYGKPYMFWHSLWHLFSAYAGYVVGSEHYYNTLPPP